MAEEEAGLAAAAVAALDSSIVCFSVETERDRVREHKEFGDGENLGDGSLKLGFSGFGLFCKLCRSIAQL